MTTTTKSTGVLENKDTRTPLQRQFLKARDVSAPIVLIRSVDPAATVAGIIPVTVNMAGSKRMPVVQWDAVNGYQAANPEGHPVVQAFKKKCQNPVEALETAIQAPDGAAIVMLVPEPDKFWRDMTVVQAVWNLRNHFKTNARTLVIVSPTGGVPLALEHDVLIIDEPLPGPAALQEIIIKTCEAAGKGVPKGDDLARAIDAVSGLSAFAAEQSVALSVKLTGLDLDTLRERHRQMIQNTKGLHVWRGGETFADVGGLANFKDFATRLKYKFGTVLWIDEIEKAFGGLRGDLTGISQDYLGVLLSYMTDQKVPGILLMGHPGCAAGDTLIEYNRGERVGTRSIRLDEFYKKFNGIKTDTRPFMDLSLPTYVHSLADDGVMFRNRVIAVLESGVKDLVRVEFDDGNVLRVTPDHPVLSAGCGFVEAGNLRHQQVVIAEGSMCPRKGEGKQRPAVYRPHVATRHHPYGQEKIVEGYEYKLVRRYRLVVEAALNNMPYAEFVHALRNNADLSARLVYLQKGWDVHHLDGNPLNDDISNLQVLPHDEHARLHGKSENFDTEFVREVRVTSVVADGREMTYDIQMDDPARNFVANGIVVHNTGKSLLAKALGNTARVPTIRMDLGAMHGSLVGESQHALRHALKVTTAISQGHPLFVATCNSVAILPPEFLNRFKWRFFVDMPSREEKDAVWPIQLKQHGLSADLPRPDDGKWNGREIEQVCETAVQLGCDLIEAAKFVVPIAESSAEAIELRRREASGRYLSASHSGVFGWEAKDVIVGGRKINIRDEQTWVAPGGDKVN